MKDPLLSSMAGQRLMVGFDGTAFTERLGYLIGTLNIGGFILFARNMDSPGQIRALIRHIKSCSADHDLPVPFVAVDQEGGVVARLKPPFTCFPDGNPGLKTVDDADRFAAITGEELCDVGFNMDMAPVLDCQPPGFTGVMDKRVFQGDKSFVGTMGASVIKGLQAKRIVSVVKHFPGIGRTTLDSHFELPVVETSMEDLWNQDMAPFRDAVKSDAGGIMLSHIRYSDIDPFWPASLSPLVTRDILRKKMGYQGLVLTDDLDMKAVKVDIETSMGQILVSDIDLALICHESNDIDKAHQTIMDLMATDPTLYAMGENSIARIKTIKERIGVT